ncbi:MAG: UvrD-helicase domain-containing protein [Eubacterium sp.]|nr:UvrD-helicase domain-containing protein [Eubacterium sp.]
MLQLNEMQKEAVNCTEGPLLILAGAGSGKTGVITQRTAHLVKDLNVAPWNILAITFTNKAAGEMRSRIVNQVGPGGDQIWISTFHSLCTRILRRYADRIGYKSSFSIYDTDDQKAMMRRIIKEKNLDPKMYRERTILNAISAAKNELIDVSEYRVRAAGNFDLQKKAELYQAYENELKNSNAMDFDDLLFKTVILLMEDAEVRQYYQERFKYVMVDEYQDTNTAQFRLVKLLCGKYRNICVVGDDDQSIYKFRGANIRNILDFENEYPGARLIRLEENYRSTGAILDVANAVISHNSSRKGKTLYTRNERGERVRFEQFDNAYEEASYVATRVKAGLNEGMSLSQFAVLYRTNAQSRILEEQFVSSNIPYKVVGGVNFYSRKEIKDVLAYLKAVDNPDDDLTVRRIINVPKRGIGQTTIDRVSRYAAENGMSFYEALGDWDRIVDIKPAAGRKLQNFVSLMESFKADAKGHKRSGTREVRRDPEKRGRCRACRRLHHRE